jgi:branched-chain amino acid transport system permease protein
MDPAFLFVQALSGLANASSLFIIASGLTIVFGVTRIVNFAHGSLFMLGAYFAVTLMPRFLDMWSSLPMFLTGVIIAAVGVALVAVLMEVVLLKRIYRAPELLQLLATFGVVLIVQDLVIKVWGPLDILGPRVPGLRHAVEIVGRRFPAYELFLIVTGPIVFGVLYLIMQRTRYGILVRAATQDRDMVAALGVNQALLFTGTLALGGALAGLGGALQTPRVSANPQMDISILTEAFVVTVIGGMGSLPGAALAALIIGQLQAFGILIFPKITLVLVFLLMAAVLIVRPWGLLGRPDPLAQRVVVPEGFMLLRPPGRDAIRIGLGGVAALAVLPFFADAYLLKVMIEILIFALAAFSLAFLISNAGLVSFGHAAYFGLGAYGAGLAVKSVGLGMEAALVVAPLVAWAGALAFGYFIVRLSGIYLAMLTLAVAQIVYAVAFQWVEVTGGDNGLVGIRTSAWANSRVTYYYLVLILTSLGIAALWRLIHAPFGYSLRAARDSAIRAEAIGIDVKSTRWLGFGIAGAAAGLSGGLYAFSKGTIDPTMIAIPMSVDFLSMVLVGGIQTLAGSLVGAGAFHALKDFVMPLTDYWRALLGLLIITIVLAFPTGLAGAAEGVMRRRAEAPR